MKNKTEKRTCVSCWMKSVCVYNFLIDLEAKAIIYIIIYIVYISPGSKSIGKFQTSDYVQFNKKPKSENL